MTRRLLAAFCLMLFAVTPALAELPIEAGDPLAPCERGSKSRDDATASGPAWGIEIASAFNEDKALDEFAEAKKTYHDILGDYAPMVLVVCDLSMGTDLRYSARIGMEKRDAADTLCAKLRTAGGACIVLKN